MNDIKNKATIGIFGGSGFYSFLDDVKEYTIETPYGKTRKNCRQKRCFYAKTWQRPLNYSGGC